MYFQTFTIVKNLPWGHVRSHKKFGFSRFDVLLLPTNKQEKQNRYGLAFVHSCIWLRFSSLDGKTIS